MQEEIRRWTICVSIVLFASCYKAHGSENIENLEYFILVLKENRILHFST
jgi:hypothetical protein